MQAMGGGEKLTLVLAEHLSLAHNVRLFCAEPLEISSLQKFFGVDLSRVTICPLNSVGPFWRTVARAVGSLSALSIHHYRQLKKFNLDIFINNSYASGMRCPAPRGIFMCMFPHPATAAGENLIGRAVIDRIESPERNPIDSYSTVVAISNYSANWVRQLWKRRSEIIYPPCDNMGPPATKRKIILNVGRFIADKDDERHHKGQGLLLEAFKRMTDLHRDGWELHFAGSVGADNDSVEFAQTLLQNVGSFPVFFHLNAPREEIRDLYRTATIYWHATGYGFDGNKYPAKQEHFGIATVEAMSAAAVPVVYSSGGQKEIVSDGVDGFWWEDIDGLAHHTRKLVNDPALRWRLGHRAMLSSERFAREAFTGKIDNLISELLPDSYARSFSGKRR